MCRFANVASSRNPTVRAFTADISEDATPTVETMRKPIFFYFFSVMACLLAMLPVTALAQQTAEAVGSMENPLPVAPRYGYCSHKQLLESMPEYVQAIAQLKSLRGKYESEASHNEEDFRRRFQEYLQGQKEFPEAILLKRQADLERSMEEGLAFRAQADSLLQQAEIDLMRPLHARIDAAIRAVAIEHGYECVVNTDAGAFPFFNPALSEDITAFVSEKLRDE